MLANTTELQHNRNLMLKPTLKLNIMGWWDKQFFKKIRFSVFCVMNLLAKEQSTFEMVSDLVGDRGSTVVKVLCHKSESRSFDPSWCQ